MNLILVEFKGKRGRGAGGKTPVFGLLKHGGMVYTKIIPNAKSETLIPIIEKKLFPIALSIVIHLKAIMRLMLVSLNIIELTIANSS